MYVFYLKYWQMAQTDLPAFCVSSPLSLDGLGAPPETLHQAPTQKEMIRKSVFLFIEFNVLTVSGMYRSGMAIFSGTPNKLSIAFVLIFVRPGADAVPSFLLSKADLMTSGVLKPRIACSISKSSLDRADSYKKYIKQNFIVSQCKITFQNFTLAF